MGGRSGLTVHTMRMRPRWIGEGGRPGWMHCMVGRLHGLPNKTMYRFIHQPVHTC